MVGQELSVTPHTVHIHPDDIFFFFSLIRNKTKMTTCWLCAILRQRKGREEGSCGFVHFDSRNLNFLWFTFILIVNLKIEKTPNEKSLVIHEIVVFLFSTCEEFTSFTLSAED